MKKNRMKAAGFQVKIAQRGTATIAADVLLTTNVHDHGVATVFFGGYPIMVIELDKSREDEFYWLESISESSPHAQALVAFGNFLGEITDHNRELYLLAIADGGVVESVRDAYTECQENGGDGHEYCAFVERVQKIVLEAKEMEK